MAETSPGLGRLLSPRSIATVGDSAACARVVEQNARLGFTGSVRVVHPSARAVGGLTPYRRVADLPEPPDAAFVAVPAARSPSVVADLAAAGCGGVVCYASGFAESPGPEGVGTRLQADLLDAAGDMPLLGPNCYGLVNYADGVLLWPDQHGGRRLRPGERGVALVSQSSSIAISLTMQDRGLPLTHVVTVGNGARLDAPTVAAALVRQPAVAAVGLLVESVGDIRAWESLARDCRRLGVPAVVLLVGRSVAARRISLTHTGTLASDAATAAAFFRRCGVGQTHSVPDLLAALGLLLSGGPLPGRSLGSLSSSGGEAALAADAAHGRAVGFPDLTPGQRRSLGEALGPRVSLTNPLDYHTYVWGDREAMRPAFAAMMAGGDNDLHLLFADLPRAGACDDTDWQAAVEAFTAALGDTGARGALTAALPETLSGPRATAFVDRGLAVLAPVECAIAAAEAAVEVGRAWAAPEPLPLHGPDPSGAGAGPAASPSGAGAGPAASVLDEAAAKALLAGGGLRVPPGLVCTDLATVRDAVAGLGRPVALKALGVAHKSDRAALRLGVTGPSVEAAARDVLSHTGRVLVEAMVPGVLAELLVGVVHEPAFGPVLTLGSGGTLVEVLRDITRVHLPCRREEVQDALAALRCAPLLAGHRGAPPAPLGLVVDAVLAIVDVAVAAGARSLEVNPLLVTADAAWCADALVVLSDRRSP